jgi:hypothetical protein
MNATEITKALDNGNITRAEAADLLGQKCTTFYLAGAYLETRKQRNEWREKAHAHEGETPEPHLANDIAMDLIGYAYLSNNIGYATAYTYLSAYGYGDAVAETYLRELFDFKNPDVKRELYLANPDAAPRYCTRCGTKVEADQLSRRGNCVECSRSAVEQTLIELQSKDGPYYRKWREGMITALYHLENDILRESREKEPSTLGDMIDHNKLPGCDGGCVACSDQECPYRFIDDPEYVDDDTDDDDSMWYCEGCDTYVVGLAACDCGNVAPDKPVNADQDE